MNEIIICHCCKLVSVDEDGRLKKQPICWWCISNGGSVERRCGLPHASSAADDKRRRPDERFRTLRHVETVRSYLNLCIRELLTRSERHDQSKLESPEMEMFDIWTNRLRASTYNSPEYLEFRKQLEPILNHHYAHNRHHPEHFKKGIHGMNLIDILEMLVDWKASSMRHNDGNVLKSISINQERFKFSDELKQIMENTAEWIDSQTVFHKANES